MTRTLPAPPRMRPQNSTSSITKPNFKPNPPSLNPPSYYSTYHPASTHHHSHYPPRPRPQFQASASTAVASTSPVKFYRQTNNYYNSYYEENVTSNMNSNMTSSLVTMRRPPNSEAAFAVNTSSNSASSSRRNAVYIKEVTPEAAAAASAKSKPPLPNDQVPKPPKPPPRSRPKSWTSTLFNAMRNNHRSVTFQCVEEENQQRFLAASTASATSEAAIIKSSEVIIATDPTMPLAAASSTEGQKFYSLPRPPASGSGLHQGKLGPTRSRTPSPFRSMIKGLVKGVFDAPENNIFCSTLQAPKSQILLLWTPKSNI